MAEASKQDGVNVLSLEDIYLFENEDGFMGKGSFGKVYRCFIDKYGDAAIKLYKLHGSREEILEMKSGIRGEANLLGKMQNSNYIVSAYGCTECFLYMGLVMEYMSHGDLNHLMSQKDVFIPFSLRVRILYETATGLDHLHRFRFDKRITHNDLKPENILLDRNFHAKICDFGGANIAAHTSQNSKSSESDHSTVHTLLYAAPELLSELYRPRNSDDKFRRTTAMDIYSFGMTTYFVLTSSRPFVQYDIASARNAIIEGERPELNVEDIQVVQETSDNLDLIKSLVGMTKKCWQKEASKRPESALNLKMQLEKATDRMGITNETICILQRKLPVKDLSGRRKISLEAFLEKWKGK